MKIVFLGTPDFAVPCLKALLATKHEIVAVVTQPDRPGNRGEVFLSPVKKFALQNGLKICQYESISKEGETELKNLKPDLMITCAFGQLLKQNILDIAPIYNVHASLLPKYRGAAPIQWCLINGEKETGVTIMKTELGLDTGDILYAEKTAIKPDETADELFVRLSQLGATALIKALNLIETDKSKLIKQDESLATTYKTLKKTDGLINFNTDNLSVFNFFRGVTSWPGAYAYLGDKILKLVQINPSDHKLQENENLLPGQIVIENKKMYVACKNGTFIEVLLLQLEGSKKLSAADFCNGRKLDKIILKGKEN